LIEAACVSRRPGMVARPSSGVEPIGGKLRGMDVISWLTRVGLMALVLVSSGLRPLPADAADAAKVLEDMEATKLGWLPSLDRCRPT